MELRERRRGRRDGPLQMKSTPDLVRDFVSEGQHLVREEIRFAKLEASKAVKEAQGAARDGAIAGLFGHVSLIFAAGTIMVLLAMVMAPWVAALIVTLALAATASFFGMRARDEFKRARLERASTSFKEDSRWAKQTIRGALSKTRASA